MKIIRLSILLCLMALAASASVITFGPVYMDAPSPSGFAFPNFGQTNFTSVISLPQFDPTLGTLTSATFSFTGTVSGNVQFENEDPTPQTVHVTVEAILELDDTTNGWSISVDAKNQFDRATTAYDGVEDFGGTSGFTVNDVEDTKTDQYTTIDGLDDLSVYTGTGTVEFTVQATGFSNGTGGASLIRHLTTYGASNASVTYDYISDVPEPATWGYIAISLVGFACFRLRRRE